MKVLLPIKNFEKQELIFQNSARFKIAAKGRRFGLTRGKANNLIAGAMLKTYKQGLWVDTINANIDRYVERYFLPTLKLLPQSSWEWKKQAKTLYIRDSYIDFRSADNPESIEGFGYDDVFLNEAGIILKNEYLWNNAIRPMLWEYQSPAVIGGTPKGGGLFKELFDRGNDESQPLYKSFRFSTFDNPYISQFKEEIENEMKSMPERVIRQEIYAEFLDDSGIVFRNVRDIADAEPQKPKSDHLYVMGVDLAKVQDFTVIAVYDRQTNRQVYQDRFNTIEWPFQKKRIVETARHYNNALVRLDATGIGDPIADDLIREKVAVEPIKFTNESKKEMIEKLSIWIDQQLIHILPIQETIAEFNNFTYDISSTGKVRYSAPVGFHDDIVFSHCLAVSGLYPLPKGVKIEEKTQLQEFYEAQKRGQKDDPYIEFEAI